MTGPVVLLLQMLEKNPGYAEEIVIPDKVLPIRMWYMHRNKICTMIDVGERNREVRIKNFTDKLMLRAFGVNEHPTFEDYQEFQESRCFPRNRDKVKLVLKELDLPFYDPFMIVEKTDGRMASGN